MSLRHLFFPGTSLAYPNVCLGTDYHFRVLVPPRRFFEMRMMKTFTLSTCICSAIAVVGDEVLSALRNWFTTLPPPACAVIRSSATGGGSSAATTTSAPATDSPVAEANCAVSSFLKLLPVVAVTQPQHALEHCGV